MKISVFKQKAWASLSFSLSYLIAYWISSGSLLILIQLFGDQLKLLYSEEQAKWLTNTVGARETISIHMNILAPSEK